MIVPETTAIELAQSGWRALVCSDSHGHTATLRSMRNAAGHVDAVIHLGDGAADTRVFDGVRVLGVSGNCDINAPVPFEQLLVVGGRRILLTHGHLYGVKHGMQRLYYRARELECDMALYGHTHRSALTNPGVQLANPGSAFASWPNPPSCALLRVGKQGLEFNILTDMS